MKLALLVGGLSSRMGSPKSQLPMKNTTLLNWRMHDAIQAGVEVSLVTNSQAPSLELESLDLESVDLKSLPHPRLIYDALEGSQGPLSGIAAVLRAHSQEPWIMISSCDHMIPTLDLMQAFTCPAMASTDCDIIFFKGEKEYPLLGLYRPYLWKKIMKALRQSRKVFDFINKQQYKTVPLPSHWEKIANFNTLKEYQHAVHAFNRHW